VHFGAGPSNAGQLTILCRALAFDLVSLHRRGRRQTLRVQPVCEQRFAQRGGQGEPAGNVEAVGGVVAQRFERRGPFVLQGIGGRSTQACAVRDRCGGLRPIAL